MISCFRCGKEIERPDNSNADYVVAADMIARESVEVLVAFKHNQETLAKQADEVPIDDSEYDQVEVSSLEAAKSLGEDLVKVIAKAEERNVQKTGIICPDCYRDTDFVIWGVHKLEVK